MASKPLKNFLAREKSAKFKIPTEGVIREVCAGENCLIVNDGYFRVQLCGPAVGVPFSFIQRPIVDLRSLTNDVRKGIERVHGKLTLRRFLKFQNEANVDSPINGF